MFVTDKTLFFRCGNDLAINQNRGRGIVPQRTG
jgi:hypothetical protein